MNGNDRDAPRAPSTTRCTRWPRARRSRSASTRHDQPGRDHLAAPVDGHVDDRGVPAHRSASGCPGVSGSRASWLGVAPRGRLQLRTSPPRSSIDTKDIGGPSAGLAMTLTLIDKLSRGSLTGNNKIAATGTIDVRQRRRRGRRRREDGRGRSAPAPSTSSSPRSKSPPAKRTPHRASVLGVTTLRQALKRPAGNRRIQARRPHQAPLSHILGAEVVVLKEWTIAEFSPPCASRRPKLSERTSRRCEKVVSTPGGAASPRNRRPRNGPSGEPDSRAPGTAF